LKRLEKIKDRGSKIEDGTQAILDLRSSIFSSGFRSLFAQVPIGVLALPRQHPLKRIRREETSAEQ
jgi:hypothetical protein